LFVSELRTFLRSLQPSRKRRKCGATVKEPYVEADKGPRLRFIGILHRGCCTLLPTPWVYFEPYGVQLEWGSRGEISRIRVHFLYNHDAKHSSVRSKKS
jgi:hypothetical protein